MSIAEGRVYRCQNRDCGCEIKVIKPSIESTSNPRCACGAKMKKPYETPVLRTLNPDAELLSRFKNILRSRFGRPSAREEETCETPSASSSD